MLETYIHKTSYASNMSKVNFISQVSKITVAN